MKRPNPPKLVTVTVSTTITIVFWIFFTLYQVLTTKPQPSVDPSLLDPLNPKLDTTNLNLLNSRIYFEEGSFEPPKIQQAENQSAPKAPTENIPSPTVTGLPVE